MYTFPQTKCKTQRNKQDSKVLRHSYLDSGNEFVVETVYQNDIVSVVFRLDALALSVIATATCLGGWVAGWVAGCHTPVLYQNG